MIISFSVFKEKLESGEKCQTIRLYSEAQYRRYLNCWKKRETTGRYNLFWHNPRNGGTRIKDVVPSDHPFLIAFSNSYGKPTIRFVRTFGNMSREAWIQNYLILFEIARRDGFKNTTEMWEWFETNYGKQMYQNKFIVIRWNP